MAVLGQIYRLGLRWLHAAGDVLHTVGQYGSTEEVDAAEERIARRVFEILREGTEHEPLRLEIAVRVLPAKEKQNGS